MRLGSGRGRLHRFGDMRARPPAEPVVFEAPASPVLVADVSLRCVLWGVGPWGDGPWDDGPGVTTRDGTTSGTEGTHSR